MSDSYGVDSLHLNVGDGECTIHLLVKIGPAASKTIIKAILVDAGPANVSRADKHVLADTLDTIRQRYGSPALRFDAVVITSWNPDYYGGIVDLLSTAAAAATDANSGAIYQIPWLAYDAQGNPLTTFYMPCAPPLHVRELALDKAGTGLVFQYFSESNKNPVKLEHFCRPIYSSQDLLGRDLLSDASPPANFVAASITSPQVLLASNPPASGKPALYCIAANSTVLGNAPSSDTAAIALLLLWNNATPQLSYYAGGCVDASTELQLIKWMTKSSSGSTGLSNAVTSMKLGCHSTDSVRSIQVVEALRPRNVFVPCGSKYNNPRWELILLLNAWLAGQDSTLATSRPIYSSQYPFYFIKELDGPTNTLRYKDLTETGQISYDSFLSPGDEDQPFHLKLADLCKQGNALQQGTGGAELLSVWDDYALWVDENHANYTEQDARDWVTEQCEYRWAQMSPIGARSHEAAGGAVHGSSLAPVTTIGVVDYVCIESRSSRAIQQQDGRVTVKYLGQIEDKCYQAATQSTSAWEVGTASKPAPASSETIQLAATRATTRHAYSQFPSSSLTKLRNSTKRSAGRSNVLTKKGVYRLEEPAEQPAEDETSASASNKPITQAPKILKKPFPEKFTAQVDLARSIRFSQPIQGGGTLDKCIASTKLNIQGIAGTPILLADTGAANDFVSSLRSLRLLLKDKPTVGADCDFDPEDELFSWFKSALGASSLRLSQSKEQQISSFTMVVGSQENVQSFSTKNLAHAFNLETTTVAGKDAEKRPTPSSLFSKEMGGLLADQNMLVMGLDPESAAAKAPARTLKAVLADFGLEKIADSDLAKPLADLQMVLDNDKGSRNAVWFDPDGGYRTILRLQYKSAGGATLDSLKSLLTFGPFTFDTTAVQAVLKKNNIAMVASGKTVVVARPECEISVAGNLIIDVQGTSKLSLPMTAVLVITDRQVKVDIISNATDVLQGLVERLATLASGFDLGSKLFSARSDTIQKVIAQLPQLRRISLTVDLDEQNNFKAVTAVSADVELLVRSGTADKNDGIVVLGTCTWASNQGIKLRGSLWLKPPLTLGADFQSLMPDWEAVRQLKSLNEQSMGTYLDLLTLMPKVKSVPEGVPSRINEAMIEIGTTGIAFGGVMTSEPPQLGEGKPRAYLGRVLLRASVSWATEDLSFNIHLGVDVSLLRCGKDKNDPPSRLIGHVLYKNKQWMLASVIKEFDFSNLYTLLASKTRVCLSVMLRFVRITYLAVLYKYADKKHGLQMEGVIEVGGLPLTLILDYGTANEDGSGWKITIAQGDQIADKKTKLGGVVDSLMGSEPASLPPFVGNIKVGSIAIKGQEVMGANVKDSKMKVKVNGVCFVVSANIEHIDLVFVVYRQATKLPTSNVPLNTKFFLKVSFARLPQLNLPLLGEIKQPIDEIYFAFVHDRPPPIYKNDVTKQIGLTLTDVTLINLAVAKKLVYLPYKDETAMTEKDPALAAGCHFMIIGVDLKNQTRVVLDYVFGRPGPKKDKKDKEKKPGEPSKPDEPSKLDAPSKPGEGSKTSESSKPEPGGKGPTKPTADPPGKTPKEDVKEDGKEVSTKDQPKAGKKQTAPFQKQQGFLTFTNIGVDYKVEKDSNTLFIEFDAKCVIGPLGATLVGFALYIQFGREEDLKNLRFDNISIGFEGLIIAFDKPPVTLAGAFISTDELTTTLRPNSLDAKTTTVTGKYVKRLIQSAEAPEGARENDLVLRERALSYSGGVIVRLKVWGFQAAGFYEKKTNTYWVVKKGEVKKDDVQKSGLTPMVLTASKTQDGSDSSRFFVFLKAEGVLFTLGSATVTRITAAFGYNMALRWPRVEEVPNFPFVSMSVPAATPMDQLKSLTSGNKATSWITPKDGEKWLAAGLRVEAAQVIAVDAVLMVQWAPRVLIGLCGVILCQLPSVASDVKFAFIEIGFKATVDPEAGEFRLEAQLSPNSFLLDPNCHLRGGMALCIWWKPETAENPQEQKPDHSGDWVFTVGGYHKSFNVPAHYPRPERLSIDWRYGDAISIRGEAYFAITPKVCMAGGMLSITFQVGNLSAWFTAWLDMLINYSPFHFMAEGGVSIGVSYTMDLLFVTAHISVQIGATLYIEGPPMYGMVHVDFWVFGFDIPFGDDPKKITEEVTLKDFYELALQANTKDPNAKPSADKAADRVHNFNALSGLLPSSSDKTPASTEPWNVRSGTFTFSVSSRFPVSNVNVDTQKPIVSNERNLFAKPMKSDTPIKSQFTIKVFKKEALKSNGQPNPKYQPIPWKCQTTRLGLPRALWDKYDSREDPANSSSNTNNLLTGGDVCTQLTTGVILSPPPPTISDDNLEPLNATESNKLSVFGDEPPSFPELEQALSAFNPGVPDTEPEYWQTVADKWSEERPKAQDLVRYWATALSWDQTDVTKKKILSAAVPKMYIAKRESLWMRAPTLGVEITA